MRVFLAPHHDDLLLSLPVWLCGRPHDRPLHLIVVFSDENEILEALCNRIHARLEVHVHPLGMAEAARRGLGARALLRRWRRADELDSAQLRQTREALAPMLERLAPAELVAPASLVHVDHALTRLAAEAAVAAGTAARIGYYADQPYARLWPDTVALAEPLAEPPPGITARREKVRGLLSELVPFISERDVLRLLAAYGPEPEYRGERLWRCCSQPGGAGEECPGRLLESNADA